MTEQAISTVKMRRHLPRFMLVLWGSKSTAVNRPLHVLRVSCRAKSDSNNAFTAARAALCRPEPEFSIYGAAEQTAEKFIYWRLTAASAAKAGRIFSDWRYA